MEVKVVTIHAQAVLPLYLTEGSAGCDVAAYLDSPVEVPPLHRVAIGTGLVVEVPLGYEIQIRPRSGLALHKGLTLINTLGTIDSDFRGEIKVLMVNLSTEPQTIEPGERIAQAVLQKVERVVWCPQPSVDCLQGSLRGTGGFGSTGSDSSGGTGS